MNTADLEHEQKFKDAFQRYLDVYMSERNLTSLKEMLSDDFCGYGSGLDEVFYDHQGGFNIFTRDINSAPNPLNYIIRAQDIKVLDPKNAIVVCEVDIETIILSQKVKMNHLRMMMVLHEDAGNVKISGLHVSFPTSEHDGDESFPLKELEDRNELLNRIVKEQTKELFENQQQLDLFFSQSLYGFFFMMLDEPIAWNDEADKEELLDYAMTHQRISRVNQAMLHQYGAKEEEFTRLTFKDLFVHDPEQGRHILRELFDQGHQHVESREHRLDGTPIIIEGDYICLYDEQGRITGHFGVQSDITERKRAEEKAESEGRLRSILLDNLPNCIALILKKQTREIVASNKTAAKKGAVPGKTCFATCAEREDECPFCLAPELWATNQLQELEVKYRGKWYEGVWAPFNDDLYIHYIFDITEQKRAEEEREKLQSQLFQAQKMESIGLLAGGIAHDFNNLLHAMGGNLELLDRKIPEDHPGKRRIQNIQKSMGRAALLVRQMLLFSRKAGTSRQVLDLNQEIQEAVGMLERTIPRMIKIEFLPDKDLWPVNADPIQVEQVLLNLGTNAADAMPDGGSLVINTANTVVDQDSGNDLAPGRYVLMSLTDTGTGMDQDTLEKIFDPFFTTKEVGKGTGLGLASVYGIVKAHGGHITCESEPGQGTTFKIYWPVARS